MSEQLSKVFNNNEFGKLEIIMIEDRPHFPATACAKILEYSNPQEAVRSHCKGVRKTLTPSHGGKQQKNYIPEGDLYRLIIRSKLPTAEKFEHWVFDEVLPTIRKTGGYVNDDETFINTYLPFADENTKALFSSTLQVIRSQNNQLKEQEPLVKFATTIQGSETSILVRECAKLAQNHTGVKIGEKGLYSKLRQWGLVLKSKNEPSQKAIKHGWLELIEREFYDHDMVKTFTTTKVTPKGQVYIINRLIRELSEREDKVC